MPDIEQQSDYLPLSGTQARTVQQRIPTLAHLLPAWFPKDAFIGERYAQQMGDNTLYRAEQANRHEAINRDNNASPLHNFAYKQEAPHDRPDRLDPDPRAARNPVRPTAQEAAGYEPWEPRPVNRRGETSRYAPRTVSGSAEPADPAT